MLRRCQSLLLRHPVPYNSKVYELRFYDIIPSKYDAFHRLASEIMPLRSTVFNCQGYWVSQLGALNQMVQLWEFDSLQHRYSHYHTVESDEDTRRRFLIPQSTCLERQSNMLMRMTYRETAPSTKSYKYRLTITDQQEPQMNNEVTLAASFVVVVGEHEGKFVHLIKGASLDALVPEVPVPGSISKIIGPARWAAPIGCLWR